MPITEECPKGPYCQVIRVFGESKSCPSLDETKGAQNPFCTKLGRTLSWDVAGHILKQCEPRC